MVAGSSCPGCRERDARIRDLVAEIQELHDEAEASENAMARMRELLAEIRDLTDGEAGP